MSVTTPRATESAESTETRSMIAGRIRKRRMERQLSQAQLARTLGKARSAITMIEQGSQDYPAAGLLGLCQALQTDPNTLLGYDSANGYRDGYRSGYKEGYHTALTHAHNTIDRLEAVIP